MSAFVRFWGTRGSIPTPASWTRVYGGNTSCVEVRFDDTVFICDAGSGIRELGKDMVTRKSNPNEFHLLITHTHWDHIQGFPFFIPAYMKTAQIRVYGAYQLLSGQMSSEYFPVSFRDLGAAIIADELPNGEKMINGVRVRHFPLSHPGGCVGYVFEKDGKKIVYATDHEIAPQPGDKFPDLENNGPLRSAPADFLKIIEGADLLIADAQYNDKEYATRMGWGHSSCFSVTDAAIRGKVRNVALFHHDPECKDIDMDRKIQACCERVIRHNADLTVFAAREGMELKF
ncbi:MAG: beta-lactamase domain protein [Verrucomicrobiales bacterium]|nr:beta-lactamase domain protein [Verrucomicrobiales bacterium]